VAVLSGKDSEQRQEWQATEYALDLEMADGSPASFAAAEAKARRLTWHPEQVRASDFLWQTAPDPLAPGPGHVAAWPGAADLDLEALRANGEALFLLSGRADISRAAAASLDRPAAAMAAGERLGAFASRESARLAGGKALRPANRAARPLPSGSLRFLDDWLPRDHQTEAAAAEIECGACPRLGAVDTLVVGGGTAGAPAAIASAREGAETIVCEALANLGGVGTEGLIAKYYFGNRRGFTREIDRGTLAMDEKGGQETDLESLDRAGWNVEAKMAWYLRALDDAGGQAWFGAMACGVWREGGRVRGALVSTPWGYGLVEAKATIDATGNADVAAAAGAEIRRVDAESVAVQGSGLPPRQPGRQYRNTDWTFIDDSDAAGGSAAFSLAREKFGSEYDVAQILDTRERRQIVGDFSLSPIDFLAERTYPDTIVVASSNFDTHGYTIHPLFMMKPPDKKPLFARIPLRCLLPRGLEGLLSTGLGISAHRDAIPVTRMQADAQNQGFAAGVAAAWSARDGVPLREIDVRKLQGKLVEQGVLDPNVLEQEDSFPLPEKRIQKAVTDEIDTFMGLAVVFSRPERSVPLMREALERESDPERRLAYAQALGLLGDDAGADLLAERLNGEDWDEGWNYKGMGQFGLSLSPVDCRVIALGRAGRADKFAAIRRKIEALDADSAFSHVRAVCEACEALGARGAAPALARLLRTEGLGGHWHDSLERAIGDLTDNPNETEARNRSLKELHLARALYRLGDDDGLGKRTLERYGRDLRGHFARHAQAVLAEAAPPQAEPAALATAQ